MNSAVTTPEEEEPILFAERAQLPPGSWVRWGCASSADASSPRAASSPDPTPPLEPLITSAERTGEALAAGAAVDTHLFNGMRGIGHREPGPVPARLTGFTDRGAQAPGMDSSKVWLGRG